MTYKGASDNEQYLNRSGSHATRPFRNGVIPEVPPWAQEATDYYNDLDDQYASLCQQLQVAQTKIAAVNRELRLNLPHARYVEMSKARENLSARLALLNNQLKLKRDEVVLAGRHLWGVVFSAKARELLSPYDYDRINRAVGDLLSLSHSRKLILSDETSEQEMERRRAATKRKRLRHRLKYHPELNEVAHADDTARAIRSGQKAPPTRNMF